MSLNKVISEIIKMDVGECIENEPMYKHTSYKVGGPAALYLKVKDIPSLIMTIKYLKREDVPFLVIGKGSNLLFSDKEYEGVIISLNEHFNDISVNGSTMIAQAGASLIALAYEACKCGLSGLEFAGGIPASIGGAVYMNAGAYKSEMANVIQSVTVLNDEYEITELTNEEMEFSYRRSILQKNTSWIVLSATFVLESKEISEIQKLLDNRKERRMATQPWNLPSAGSVFRNPDDKPAWQYIDECGLRGKEIGGAQISQKHSNFIVNNGYASAKDILDLIILAKKEVYEKFEVRLHTEVRLVNW